MRLASVRAASGSVIPDAQGENAIATGTFNPNRSAFWANGNGMVYGIFCQRLHGKRRNIKIEGLRVNLQVYLQPVFIAKLFEGDVLACEFVLFRKLNQLAAIFFQRVAQHVSQALDGALRHGRTELHQGRKSVKSVEQEMWI